MVQVLLVALYLLTNEVFEDVKIFEEVVVLTWKVLHHSRECFIELLRIKEYVLKETFLPKHSVMDEQLPQSHQSTVSLSMTELNGY